MATGRGIVGMNATKLIAIFYDSEELEKHFLILPSDFLRLFSSYFFSHFSR